MNSRRRHAVPDPKPLVSEKAERDIVGGCLRDQAAFWDAFGKLQPEHFATPRLARVWAAMRRCGEAGKPVSATWIPMMIKGDIGEDTPLGVFMAVLMNDAPPSSEIDPAVETVVHLANKRALLESLERAKSEILSTDVGVPAEEMKDIGIRRISTAFNGDTDDDMMDYLSWGRRVANGAIQSLSMGERGGYGLSPGLPSVERIMGRLLPGKLYVLAGMSSSGKSALLRQIVEAAAVDAKERKLGYAYIASLEMTGEEYATRSLAEKLGLPSDRIEQGALNQSEVNLLCDAVERMKRYPVIVDSRVRQTIENIRARALKVKNTKGLSLIAADHLLLIKGGRDDSLLDRVSEATIEMKNMAKEFGIPAILLAQLDEKKILESTTGWPNSSHLFGGQTIMQNADGLLFVHRPEIVLAKKEPAQSARSEDGDNSKKTPWEKWNERMEQVRGRAWIFTNKRRGGAGNLKEEMLFHGPTMSFSEI